jgi:hypothetical protein
MTDKKSVADGDVEVDKWLVRECYQESLPKSDCIWIIMAANNYYTAYLSVEKITGI